MLSEDLLKLIKEFSIKGHITPAEMRILEIKAKSAGFNEKVLKILIEGEIKTYKKIVPNIITEDKWTDVLIKKKPNNKKEHHYSLYFLISVLSFSGIVFLFPTCFNFNTPSNIHNNKTSKSNSMSIDNVDDYTICGVCNRKFSGNGYIEVSNGVWEPCGSTMQCYICSPSCGRKSLKEREKVYEDYGIDPSSIYKSGSGSKNGCPPGTVHTESCPGCGGTGVVNDIVENYLSGNTNNNSSCGTCKGRGVICRKGDYGIL